MAFEPTKMVANTWAVLTRTAKRQVREFIFGQMEMSMLGIGRMTRNTAMVFFTTLMAELDRVYGVKINLKAKNKKPAPVLNNKTIVKLVRLVLLQIID